MGQHAMARHAIAQALPILKRCFDDIPDSAMRATYLQEVPENARLLARAKAWAVDTSALRVSQSLLCSG